MKTKKERAQLERETIARVGFVQGFSEGGRYVLSLLMGLPRPDAAVIDDKLGVGDVEIHYGPGTELQMERVSKLDALLTAVGVDDLKAALQGEIELNPPARLEAIVSYLQSQKVNHAAGDTLSLAEILDKTISLARGYRDS